MNRLQAELHRLYGLPGAAPQEPPAAAPGLVDADGRVRAMVLALARPASWEALSKVWQGVQADLELPAPAIAVSGIDGYQLWFSLAQPVPAAQAIAFLESLRNRYLRDVAPARVTLEPTAASASGPARNASVLPPMEVADGHWSAFVAPDLAALFADEPWLDMPPGADAQADLLSRLKSTSPQDLQRAVERLQAATPLGSSQAPASPADAPAPASSQAGGRPGPAAHALDPRGFLLEVMNDRGAELHLRIEAAKALLPYFEGQRPLVR